MNYTKKDKTYLLGLLQLRDNKIRKMKKELNHHRNTVRIITFLYVEGQPKHNWSDIMLFNNEKEAREHLIEDYINTEGNNDDETTVKHKEGGYEDIYDLLRYLNDSKLKMYIANREYKLYITYCDCREGNIDIESDSDSELD